MGLRPAHCYRRVEIPYTRVSIRVQRKSYVTGVPNAKIREFNMGNKHGQFDFMFEMVSETNTQLRHNGLEAGRIACNKVLEKNIGLANYNFKILPYPHHILREHCLATGAGADRFSSGMARAFGKVVGRAAQVHIGDVVIQLYVNLQFIDIAKQALKQAKLKFGLPSHLNMVKLREPTKEFIKVKIIKVKKEKKPAEGEAAVEGAAPAEAGKEGAKPAAAGKEGAKPAAGKDAKPDAKKDNKKDAKKK